MDNWLFPLSVLARSFTFSNLARATQAINDANPLRSAVVFAVFAPRAAETWQCSYSVGMRAERSDHDRHGRTFHRRSCVGRCEAIRGEYPFLGLHYSQVLTKLQDADLVIPEYIIEPRSILHLAASHTAHTLLDTDIASQAIAHRAFARGWYDRKRARQPS